MSEMIRISNLSKVYDERMILQDIDLEIEKGEFVCIIGPSGCGKSTLLNLVGGFLENDGGSITIKGQLVEKPNRQCIMVFQEFDQLFAWKTVKKNVAFPLQKSHRVRTKEEVENLAGHYLKMVKLEGAVDLYPHQLSGGMKQRCAIARALVTTPEVLLMDEPFGSLDIQTKKDLQATLLDIWEKTQTTILFVTHDVGEALKLADRIVILGGGEIKALIDNRDKNHYDEKMKEIIGFMAT